MLALLLSAALALDLADLDSDRNDGRDVVVCGIVEDCFPEDTDRRWKILQLRDGDHTAFVSILNNADGRKASSDIIGARVRLKGVYHRDVRTSREALRARITVTSPDDLTVLEPPPRDPFDLPRLDTRSVASPSVVAGFGRRTVTGTVLCAWNGRFMLVRPTDNGRITRIVRVNLASEDTLPPCGASVRVAGIAETDLFRYVLSRARCQPTDPDPDPAPDPVLLSPRAPQAPTADLDIADIFHLSGNRRSFNPECYGKTIRGVGTVRTPHTPEDPNGLLVECDKTVLTLNVSACPGHKAIAVGSRIAFRGICVLEIATWRPTVPFPTIDGVTLVATDGADIRILANPPWWTPVRLLTLVIGLGLLLAGILVWNLLLRRLAERRGRELAEETIARLSADLKVDERTRLAVELHDSLAQNLTGVSMEIEAAGKAAGRDPARMREHLSIAARTIKSSRDELRNCLWDLRNHALEAPDMDAAIRQTLAPHLSGATLSVRFAVPRERISDNSAHAILRIVRELTVNAIRHGKATEIRVAGSVERDKLLFSVRDNGCGFDPDSHPGVEEGHYGLVGIAERIDAFEGSFTIDSAPGCGTKAVITLNIPRTAVAPTAETPS